MVSLVLRCYDMFFLIIRRPPRATRTDTLCPYTTLFRSSQTVIRDYSQIATLQILRSNLEVCVTVLAMDHDQRLLVGRQLRVGIVVANERHTLSRIAAQPLLVDLRLASTVRGVINGQIGRAHV